MLHSDDDCGNLNCACKIALTFLKFDHSSDENLGMVFRCPSCGEVLPFIVGWRSPSSLLITLMPDSIAEQKNESHNGDAALDNKRCKNLQTVSRDLTIRG